MPTGGASLCCLDIPQTRKPQATWSRDWPAGLLLLQKRRAGSIKGIITSACAWQVTCYCASSHSRLQVLQGIDLVGSSSSPGWDSLLPPIPPDYVQLCADDECAGARHPAADRTPCCAGALTATCRRCGRLTLAGCLSCAVPAREATAACWWSPQTMACSPEMTPPLQRTPFSMCPAAENPVRRALPKGTCLWGSHCRTRSALSRTECLGGGCVWDEHLPLGSLTHAPHAQ